MTEKREKRSKKCYSTSERFELPRESSQLISKQSPYPLGQDAESLTRLFVSNTEKDVFTCKKGGMGELNPRPLLP